MKQVQPGDLTLVYYTSNFLEETNPYFLANTKAQLAKAGKDLPLVIVSQREEDLEAWKALGFTDVTNYVVGEKDGIVGRSHLNIYKQILIGSKLAKTKYVAMVEDDILYSYEHFHEFVPEENEFLYDMAKLSLFTWSQPILSFRHDRKVVNQLIADRQYLVDAMEERFKRVDELLKQGTPLEQILKFFGDPGRYERNLGVTPRKTDTFMSHCPSIVFSHEHAYGYLSQGTRKAHGTMLIEKVFGWPSPEEIMKLFYKEGEGFKK